MKCPNCGKTSPEGSKVCMMCGMPFGKVKYCQKCGNLIDSDAVFCPQCGWKCEQDVPEPFNETKCPPAAPVKQAAPKKARGIAWKIFSWIGFVFGLMFVIAYMPSLSGLIFLVFSLILMPIGALQNAWNSLRIKGAIKGILLAVLFIAGVSMSPASAAKKSDQVDNHAKEPQKVSAENDPAVPEGADPEKENPDENPYVADKSDNFDDFGEIATLPAVEEDSEEIDREQVLKIDSAIWDRVLSAEKNYNNLLETMNSTDSLYSVYKFCEDLESLMSSYISDIGKISDDSVKEYVECAGIYMSQIDDIAGHIKKYANKTNMKELSKAQDGMENLPTFIEAIVMARFSYLSACGFSDQEIIEIGGAE